MEQDKGQFKVPDSESQPSVDNFSPPNEEGKSAESFAVPKTETFKTPPSDEEVEDVFEVPAEKPVAPKDNRGEPISPSVDQGGPVSPESSQGEQKFNLPPEKKGHGCLWAIIIVIILFLLLAGAIFVNEWGILNLGIEKYYGAIHLEKLWGGLPKESKLALADSVLKMKGKSFKLEGSTLTNLFLNSSQDSSLGAWAEGLDLQDEIILEAKVQNKDKLEISFTAEIDSDSTALNNLLAGDSAIDLTAVYDRPDIYLKSETLKRVLSLDKDWLKVINNSETSGTSASKIGDLISGGERVGSQKVDGVSCYVYEVKINSAAFQSLVSNYANLGWLGQDASFTTAKFYLGKRDHYIHKAEINFSHNPSEASLENKLVITFKNIGSNIQITPPSADEIAEKNWSEVRNAFITGATIPAQGTPEERDQKRKADLKTIQDALLAYKVQNGNYPSTLGAVEKTRDVASNLKSALVPKYLEALPVDPESEKYYYGYKSDDGASCELSSILEVRTDPEGESVGSYWIYKLRGN